MKNQQLHEDLQKLRNEVNHLSADDHESREKLVALINDLEKKLENPEEDNEGLVDHLKETIQHFETEYPRATAILNDIMVTLSNMGI